MTNIGEQITKARLGRGISMEQAEAQLRALRLKDERGEPLIITASTLSRIEGGTRLPHTRTLMAISAVLGVSFIVHDGGIEIVEPAGEE